MDESLPMSGRRIIDLTQMYEPHIPVQPGHAGPRITRTLAIAEGAPVNAESFSIGLHTGTHVDAPYIEQTKETDRFWCLGGPYC
jgi:arylformamidase